MNRPRGTRWTGLSQRRAKNQRSISNARRATGQLAPLQTFKDRLDTDLASWDQDTGGLLDDEVYQPSIVQEIQYVRLASPTMDRRRR